MPDDIAWHLFGALWLKSTIEFNHYVVVFNTRILNSHLRSQDFCWEKKKYGFI